MKRLLFFLLLSTALSTAQQFQHIVIVVQENRTPDNLFSACSIPGADLARTGSAVPLVTSYDLAHSHNAFKVDSRSKWSAKAKAYVQASDIQPYCQMATQGGFANRMFQTNQGPSFPAHQFLFGGTSAVDDGSTEFASENTIGTSSCIAPPSSWAASILPNGQAGPPAYPCFERGTLSDLLDAAGLSWRYYAVGQFGGGIWVAPGSIQHICRPLEFRGKLLCSGAEWANVEFKAPQFLTDLQNCALPNVSWVTPGAAYSDHAKVNNGTGPSWVASIVNSILVQPTCLNGETYWKNTAILVTWDDWGGWYDHVAPPVNNTGWCVAYCYGFRVPLLVLSSYTPAGYVDNNVHDFGSILKFVETNFGLGLIGTGTYADAYADDLGGFFKGSQTPWAWIAAPNAKFTDDSNPDDD